MLREEIKMLGLLKIELRRLISELKNYRLNQIVGIFDVILLCAGILIGTGKELFPGEKQEYALIGMILWRSTVVCLQTCCDMIQKEFRLGTIEQLMMARYSFLKVMIARLTVKVLVEGGKLMLATAVLSVMFKIEFHGEPNLTLTIAVILVSLFGAFGMGFVVAGIAMIYKKANALVNSVSYFMLFFTGALIPLEVLPDGFSPIAKIFPFIWAVKSIQQNQISESFIMLMISSLAWLIFGVGMFVFCNEKAQAQGTVGKY